MCPLDTIPYFKEIAFGVLIILFAFSMFKKEKCPCAKEIQELKDKIQDMQK